MTHVREREPRPHTFERVYEGASVEELWILWTTKDGLEEWFAPEGFRVEMHALDVRVGGAFVHEMTAVSDAQIAYLASVGRPRATRVHGRFVEVVPHERLHIRMTVDFVPGLEPHPIDIVVTFASEGSCVRMVVTAGPHPDLELTRLAGEGMTSQLRRFDSALASRGKEVHRG
jgi:uncharacterized protein YndB with AHSA1/START domain